MKQSLQQHFSVIIKTLPICSILILLFVGLFSGIEILAQTTYSQPSSNCSTIENVGTVCGDNTYNYSECKASGAEFICKKRVNTPSSANGTITPSNSNDSLKDLVSPQNQKFTSADCETTGNTISNCQRVIGTTTYYFNNCGPVASDIICSTVDTKKATTAEVTQSNTPKTTSNGTTLETAGVGTVKGESSDNASITDILIGLVLAIITLIIWIAGTIANSILWLVMTIFVFLLRINPADANWIKVAIAPWSVIQSISNLTILGAFLYVGFGYLLNIQKLKTRIDTFLTNIVIVAIVTNMTLLGTAAIVNIAQGVGDAFVGGYAY
jgi:hypothetical protein